jgi:two-component system, OmpR family, copper resistance phosphate regulon response regulator CusR
VNSFRILLVEDDPKLGKTIQVELRLEGFEVDLAFDGKVAETLFRANRYTLVLLDINVPYKNGWELCKQFRSSNRNIPIIMLTALGDIQDKMDAFNAGADDFLVKPFHLSELSARIKVFIKRMNKDAHVDDVLTASDLTINVSEKTVQRAGTEIVLTVKEFSLLELLMRHGGRVVSKAEIAEKVWNVNFDTGTNTIEVYINFLRNKIDKPFDKPLLHTKPGFGYYIKAL